MSNITISEYSQNRIFAATVSSRVEEGTLFICIGFVFDIFQSDLAYCQNTRKKDIILAIVDGAWHWLGEVLGVALAWFLQPIYD